MSFYDELSLSGLESHLSEIESLLNESKIANDLIGIIQFESRKNELEQRIRKLKNRGID